MCSGPGRAWLERRNPITPGKCADPPNEKHMTRILETNRGAAVLFRRPDVSAAHRFKSLLTLDP